MRMLCGNVHPTPMANGVRGCIVPRFCRSPHTLNEGMRHAWQGTRPPDLRAPRLASPYNKSMTTREKCAHLLRRFGLGVSKRELDAAEALGVNGTIDWLLNYERVEEPFDIKPWSFAFDKDGKANMDVSRFTSWWAARMLLTRRPLEQNLTLFWHNHFAISGAKVNFGPMMVDYIENLRTHASGNFRTLLGEMTRDPAMVRWLDTDTNVKGSPNENFAREVMELFTLGVGNYSEKDIKEATRAFTGWSLRNALPEANRVKIEMQLQMALEQERPIIVFSDAPALHDRGQKTLLGKTGAFDADDVLDLLVKQPAHARFIAAKLWKFYVSPDPTPKEVDRLAAAYVGNKFEIKPTLLWIMKSKEFWGEGAVRSIVKSPVHYTISLYRQLALDEVLSKQQITATRPLFMAPKEITDIAGPLVALMRRQGMYLMFPPDVAGWDWGTSWITTASVIEREKMGDYLFRNRPGVAALVVARLAEQGATTSAQVVDLLVDWFDVPVDDTRKSVLVEAIDANGGFAALAKPNTAQKPLAAMFRLVTAIPEYQFC